MKLRKLELKDAPLMLSWMHDESVTKDLCADFASKTLDDAEIFIRNSWDDKDNINLAIASEEDEYMGTVSLKHIVDYTAEFAIAVRTEAMGKGYSWFGMEEMLRRAFSDFNLESVYWCVSRENYRAVRFYDKHNFHETVDIPDAIADRYADCSNLKWYSMLKGDDFEERDAVAGCKIVHINTIPTLNSGELSFFESKNNIPFDIKRVYYISKVPEGVKRGFHAHRELKQLLFCPYGRIQLILENENGKEEIELADPSTGVLIVRPTWREMLWLQKDSVLCVAASDYYDAKDYIREYEVFKTMIKKESPPEEKTSK